MSNPTFAQDQNGYPIAALAPQSLQTHTLDKSGSIALSADSEHYRTLRLLATETDAVVGVGREASYTLPLAAGIPEFIKLEPDCALHAQGSGALYITVMR